MGFNYQKVLGELQRQHPEQWAGYGGAGEDASLLANLWKAYGQSLPGEDQFYSMQRQRRAQSLGQQIGVQRQLALNDLERRGVGQSTLAGGVYNRFADTLSQGLGDIQSDVYGQEYLAHQQRFASALDYRRQRELMALQAALQKKANQPGFWDSLAGLAGAVAPFFIPGAKAITGLTEADLPPLGPYPK